MAVNSAIIDPTLIEDVDTAIKKLWEERTFLTDRIKKMGSLNTLGRRIIFYTAKNPSFSFFGQGGLYAVPGKKAWIAGRIFPTRCSQGFDFEGTLLRELSDRTSIIKGLTNYLAPDALTAKKKIERAFVGSVFGSLGVVNSIASAPTITFYTTYAGGSTRGARFIDKNGRYAFYTSSGTQHVGGSVTVSVAGAPDQANAQVVFDTTPSDIAQGDRIVYADPQTTGSYNKSFNGLEDFVASTGVIQTIDRSLEPTIKSTRTNASTARISAQVIDNELTRLQYRMEVDKVPSNIELWSSPVQKSIYKRSAYNLTRFVAGNTLKTDFADVGWSDRNWNVSPDIDDDKLYGLNLEGFGWWSLKDWGRYDEDGMPWRLNFSNGSASDAFTGWNGCEGNYSCVNFNENFCIENLEIPSDASAGYQSVFI